MGIGSGWPRRAVPARVAAEQGRDRPGRAACEAEDTVDGRCAYAHQRIGTSVLAIDSGRTGAGNACASHGRTPAKAIGAQTF